MNTDRLHTLVLARVATARTLPTAGELARALRRFAPATMAEAEWADRIARAIADSDAAAHVGDLDAIHARLGASAGKTWSQLADRALPLRGLGVAPGDGKLAARLKDRDAWTAAIAARLLGLWDAGAPPSLPAVCDAFAWRGLGLTGKPKRCPPEVRAVFLQRELGCAAGPPDRLLRQYVGRELSTRPELRALRDAVVARWLVGRALAPAATAAPGSPAFATEVHAAARTAHDGVFGDRKVFISSVWNDLRRRPAWASLTLDDFKHRLIASHRAGDVVLARADLVAAMNPELVAASEIEADGASFHFIVREDA